MSERNNPVSDISKVNVVGCDLMEAGIAEICARADLDVLVAEVDHSAVVAGPFEEFKEPLYAAPPLLQRMVDAGLTSRRSGRGF